MVSGFFITDGGIEMGKYTKLLWDVDETLLDFTAAENNGVQAVLRAYGVEPDAEKIACYSRINDSLWKACERGEITAHGVDNDLHGVTPFYRAAPLRAAR